MDLVVVVDVVVVVVVVDVVLGDAVFDVLTSFRLVQILKIQIQKIKNLKGDSTCEVANQLRY